MTTQELRIAFDDLIKLLETEVTQLRLENACLKAILDEYRNKTIKEVPPQVGIQKYKPPLKEVLRVCGNCDKEFIQKTYYITAVRKYCDSCIRTVRQRAGRKGRESLIEKAIENAKPETV